MKREPAPLYRDACLLCEWLLGRMGDDPRALPRTTCEHALTLLDAVTLALRGWERAEQLDRADELLVGIRNRLRMAVDTGLLTADQGLHAFELADRVGRQVGGWIKALGAL